MAGISISTVYDNEPLRRPIAIRYRCQACGEEWDHPSLTKGMAAETSAPFDNQCKKHWAVCTQRERP